MGKMRSVEERKAIVIRIEGAGSQGRTKQSQAGIEGVAMSQFYDWKGKLFTGRVVVTDEMLKGPLPRNMQFQDQFLSGAGKDKQRILSGLQERQDDYFHGPKHSEAVQLAIDNAVNQFVKELDQTIETAMKDAVDKLAARYNG